MASTRRILTALLLIGSLGFGQKPEDLLPEGVTLGAGGKFAWAEFQPKPCGSCKGEKTVACCEGKPEGCWLCTDGRRRCSECRGTGQTSDPFASSECGFCSGIGSQYCRGCGGEGKVVTAAAEGPCSRCQGKRSFVCPLCAGSGRLRSISVEGRDARRMSRAQLDGALAAVKASIEAFDSPGPASVATSRPARADALARRVAAFAPLPEGQPGRLAALLASAAPEAEPGRGMPFDESYYLSAISRYLDEQQALLERASWVMRRNAGGAPKIPARKASEVQWQGWFGEDPANKSDAYTLLGRGFIRTPSAPDTDQVIADWIKAHPEATIVEVSSFRTRRGGLDIEPGRHVHVWMIDKAENLGLELVRKGCVPGGTMVAARPEVDVDFTEYFEFIKKVVAAEADAKTSKRGLWKARLAERGAKTHRETGAKLMEAGKFAEAAEELRKSIDLDSTEKQTLLDLGECLEKLDRRTEALEVYDQAIGDGQWWPPYLSRALCLEKLKGVEAAVSWIESIPSGGPGDRKVPYLLASFHNEAGRPKEAVAAYQKVVTLVCDKHGFKFDDEGWLVLDEATRAKKTEDFTDLWPTLEEMARCALQSGQQDLAFRTATMGVAAAQQYDRDKTYLEKERIEAGNVVCRIVRARVFLSRMKLEEASRELRMAKIGNGLHGYSGYANEIAELEAKVAEAGKGK